MALLTKLTAESLLYKNILFNIKFKSRVKIMFEYIKYLITHGVCCCLGEELASRQVEHGAVHQTRSGRGARHPPLEL